MEAPLSKERVPTITSLVSMRRCVTSDSLVLTRGGHGGGASLTKMGGAGALIVNILLPFC